LKGLGEEQLAVEAIESRIVLEEEQAGVTQNTGCGLNRNELCSDDRVVRRGIVLHFLTWLEVVAS
jgi:hypothetical protein